MKRLLVLMLCAVLAVPAVGMNAQATEKTADEVSIQSAGILNDYLKNKDYDEKEFEAFIERIEMFPEKRKDGSWIRNIVFNFPVPVDVEDVKELPLETETTVESVALLERSGN